MNPRLALLILVGALAGCQTPTDAPKPASASPPKPVAAEPLPPLAPEPKVPEGPPPGSPAARAQAQQLLKQAAESLNEGRDDLAREEIDQALALDQGNKLGTCLMRGLTADPQEALGRDSTSYTVRPGETLGSIAQRALGEGCEFYLLARYNQIRVPRQLFAGQILKIPGKKTALPAPGKSGADASAVEAAKTPTATESGAPTTFTSARAALAAAETRSRIERHQRAAIAAFRKQDLATSIKEWDKLLELDPTNDLARARRQEAIELQRRLQQVK